MQSYKAYNSIVRWIGWVVIATSAMVLLSWIFDIEAGKRILPVFQSMKFNTALCFLACGFIFLRKWQTDTDTLEDPVTAALAFLVLMVSGLTLLEYGLGWQLGIDNLVIMDEATAPADFPGRMSAGTALCFSLIGAAWLVAMSASRRATLAMQLLALTIIAVGGAVLIGYVFGVQRFRLSIFSSMALHTSALFVVNGAGMLFVRPGGGLMSPAASPYIGGRSLRRLLPFIIVTPVVAGWLSLQGVAAGYYTEAFGFALSSAFSILVLGVVGWLGADALNREEERFRSTIDCSPIATIMVDKNGTILMANRLAHSLFRCPDNQLLGRPVEHLVPDRFHPEHEGYRRDYMHQPAQRMMGKGRELFALRCDGTEFRAEIALNPVHTADGRYVMAAVVDITERVRAEQKIIRLNRMHKVLSGINALIVRSQTREVLCKEATRITVEDGGLPVALVVQHDRASGQCKVLHAYAADTALESRQLSECETDAVRQSLEQHRVVVDNELEARNGNGNLRDLVGLGIRALVALPLTSGSRYSGDQSPDSVFVLYRREPFAFDQPEMLLLQEVAGDISFAIDNIDKSQQLEHLTHFDSVTNLPNRLLLTDRLKQAMFQADNQQGAVGILYVDIDRFKQVNDSLGHNGGDDVLRQVAQRISACVDKADTVSRWGGDEFIVMLPGQSGVEVSEIAQCINNELHSLIVLGDGRELFVSCSMGIAEYPRSGKSMDALINSARNAMAAIKEHGGNDYRQFVPESDGGPGDKLALETSLRHALKEEQFEVYYQPQIDVASRKVVGFEALVRWHHPTQGMIAPDRFIPLAEKTGLILPIGEWVLREACRQSVALHGLKMAVNLSARQFHQDHLVDVVRQILNETGMRPADLELEITESALIYDVESAIVTMSELNDLGVSISLDDFGTGYSSLSYLKRFPIDTLKIDKSFIAEVTTDPGSKVIVNTIIAMAHNLNLKVIAEGIETEEQFAMMQERSCDQAQGYLFARPLPYEEAIKAMGL